MKRREVGELIYQIDTGFAARPGPERCGYRLVIGPSRYSAGAAAGATMSVSFSFEYGRISQTTVDAFYIVDERVFE